MPTTATTEPRRTQRIRSLTRSGCTCATKESLGPGITRIRGNLCNVHGRYGPCDASASGKKKPAKGRAAAKPRQTPEQRATARAQQRQTNIDSVAQRMADSDTGLSPSGVAAMTAFADGTPPDATTGAALAKMGLAEQAADGSYRMTPTGRAAVSAMEAGDYQRAVDTISRGTDASGRRQERATAAQARQQAAAQRKAEVAQRRADAQAKRAARAAEPKPKPKKQEAGSKKPEATPSRRHQRRASRGASSGGSSGGGSGSSEATPKPKAPATPKPTIAPALTAAASKLSAGEPLSEAEQQALVRNGLARPNKNGALILTASGLRATQKAAQGHTGVMIALYPDADAAKQIAAQAGVTEPVDQLHLTLAFLGDSTETALATNKDKVVTAIQQWATEKGQSLTGTINGLGRFFHSEDDDTNAVFVSPDVPGLPELRQSCVEWVERSGFDYAQNHGFTPHITVAYVPIDAPTPAIRIETPVLFDRVTLAWGDETFEYPMGAATQKESFTVFKDTSGADRWLSISSTAYRDRDREIVSTKALDGAVALADASGYRGPLRYWHVPGADLGDCDYQATMMDGRFLIESGTFRSPDLAAAVKAHASDYRMSIGFTHPSDQPDASGVFTDIAIFERSLVPAGRESNPFTQLTTTKEQRMLTDEKAAGLRNLLGGNETLLQGLLGQVATTDKAAQDGGIVYKEAETLTINGVVYAPVAVAEKAAAPPVEVDEVIETKADIPEVLAEEVETEEVGDDNMLNDAEIGAIAQAVISALMPHLDMEKKMSGYLTEMKTLLGGQMAQKDATVAELKADVTALKATVADLNGSQPRITAGGFRASQANQTITNNEKLKEAVPTADPVVQSFQGFMSDMGIGPVAGV